LVNYNFVFEKKMGQLKKKGKEQGTLFFFFFSWLAFLIFCLLLPSTTHAHPQWFGG
jgi:hypothetical protein